MNQENTQLVVPVKLDSRAALLRGFARQGQASLSLSSSDIESLSSGQRRKLADLMTEDGFSAPVLLADATVEALQDKLDEALQDKTEAKAEIVPVTQGDSRVQLQAALKAVQDGINAGSTDDFSGALSAALQFVTEYYAQAEVLEHLENLDEDSVRQWVLDRTATRDLLDDMPSDDIVQWAVRETSADVLPDEIGQSEVLQWLEDSGETRALLDRVGQADILCWIKRNCDLEDVLDDFDREGVLAWVKDRCEPEEIASIVEDLKQEAEAEAGLIIAAE